MENLLQFSANCFFLLFDFYVEKAYCLNFFSQCETKEVIRQFVQK